MDTNAFIRWALDDARTVDERYTVELLVEQGVSIWNGRRKIYVTETLEQRMERSRNRKLNPAYEPTYSEESLCKAAEWLGEITAWMPHSDRPVRSLAPLRFFPTLQSINMATCCEPVDVSPLAELPALQKLVLGYPGATMYNSACRDFTPLARCVALRELTLGFNCPWPDLTGLDSLPLLEKLEISGNLLAMPPGATFPHVRTGRLSCMPLAVRNVAALPQFPACEVLFLSGAERLDGIEKMPHLGNLTISGPFESFAPLEALKELKWLTVTAPDHRDPARQPRDVSPLARLPKLQYFKIGPEHTFLDMPRDYSPLAESPALRELVVLGCPPVAMEVAAINAALPACDDLYVATEPRAIPPLRMIVAPQTETPRRPEQNRGPDETGVIDPGLRECEARWVERFVADIISKKIGHQDWGEAKVDGLARRIVLTIESFEVVEKLPEILDAAREAISRLHYEYVAMFMICLRVPPPKATPAQQKLEEKFREQGDEWEYEQRQQEQADYIERLHLLDLKKEEGAEIKPEEFSPAERDPYPEPPWEVENENDDDDDGEGCDIAIKEKPEPPPSFFDDEHPLADNYRLLGHLTLEEAWFLPHHRDVAVYLMRREPDLELPEEPGQ